MTLADMMPMRAAMRLSALGLTGLLLTSVFPPAMALESDRDQPLKASASHVEFDNKRNVAVYRGNVKISQGSLLLEGDRVEVRSLPAGGVETVQATGTPARMSVQLEGRAERTTIVANRIDYDVSARVLELTGGVTVEQGRERFVAPSVRYELDAQSLQAAGDDTQRVTAIIYPREHNTKP